MRFVLAFSLLALVACANNPIPAVDAGGTLDAPSAIDAALDAPSLCTPACSGGQLCCPVALSYGCVAPTAAGVCPVPDLEIDGARAGGSARIVWQEFAADDCVIAEGCVAAAGWRRLMVFDTFTPNVGTGDLHMGDPTRHPELFQYSTCHMHYHFNGYANYQLIDGSGAVAAEGHKQAFCLEDSEQVLADAAPDITYDCNDQGIARGWGDLYYASLPCQWIDVTDVAPGDYMLRIDINGGRDATEHPIAELGYDNNTAIQAVHVSADDPSADPTAACPAAYDGPRDCGWTNSGTFDCTPGASVAVGCGGDCGVGNCHGDAVMRICPDSTPCTSHTEIGEGDDECGGAGANACPGTTFTCPTSGHYTVLTGPFYGDDTTVSCVPAAGANL